MDIINPSPVVHAKRARRQRQVEAAGVGADEDAREPIDALEVFEHVRDIKDPEHPYSLEQLDVVDDALIAVDDAAGHVRVQFTPTVPHCSMSTLIGLCIRVRLLQALAPRFKVDISVTPGSHASEDAINKQLGDKERVAAALENPNLVAMVAQCLGGVGEADDGQL